MIHRLYLQKKKSSLYRIKNILFEHSLRIIGLKRPKKEMRNIKDKIKTNKNESKKKKQ